MTARHRTLVQAVPVRVVTPEAFTVEEAAHRLGFRHRSSVYDLIARGDLVACPSGADR